MARRDRSRIRPDRHDDQALGEAARASASVSTVSSSSASPEPSREASTSTVAGSSGSRVVAVSASSRCQRTSSAIRSTPSASKPIRVAIARAIGSPATLCSVRLPLPMSCSSAATMSTSGRADLADQRRGLDAGLDDVPVDGEAVDRRGVRQQPDPLPLGQDPRQRTGLLERLPGAEQPPARGEQPHQQPRASAGHGSGSGAHSRARRAAVGGASTTSRSAAAAAARSSSTGSSAGRARRSSTISPPASATPSATGVSDGRRAVGRRGRAGPARRPRGAR